MEHLEAGECSLRTAVEMVLNLYPKPVLKADQIDFPAVMVRRLG